MLTAKLTIVHWLVGMGGSLKHEVTSFISKLNHHFIISKKYGSCLILEHHNFNEFSCFLLKSSSADVSPSATPSSTPLSSTHAPKYGTVIPNRIFVGGIAANVSLACLQNAACQLKQLYQQDLFLCMFKYVFSLGIFFLLLSKLTFLYEN